MRWIGWSLDHPRQVLFAYGVVFLLALASLAWWIPTRLNPALRSPLLAVVSNFPNQSPAQVESLTTGLERSLARLPSLLHIRSTSMHELSIVVLEFPYGFDSAQMLPQVAAQLPSGSRVIPYDPLDLPVLSLAVSWPGSDPGWLREKLERECLETFQRVPGVARVSLFGPRQRLEVSLKPDLDAVPVGRPTQRRLDPALLLEAESVLSKLNEVSQLKTLSLQGKPFADRARFRVGPGHDSPLYRFNGQPAFEVSCFQTARASSPELVSRLRGAVAGLRRMHPGIVVEEAYNNAHFVGIVQANVWLELVLAVLLTGAVVWFFLGEVRGTLIALATVPTALAVTLLGFVPLGLSLNSTSLVGLLLALGRLVDDTVIDLHAVAAHRALGKSPRQAALDGCSEVRPAVLSSTLVLALAVLPLTWCGGLTQDMFVGIVWPFLLSLAASLLVSLTLTPVLASLVAGGGSLSRRWENRYRRWLRRVFRNGGWVLGLSLALCYLAWTLLPWIGSEMMPLSDTGQLYVEMEAPPNSSSEQTAGLAASLESLLRACPEVLGVSTEIGMEPHPAALSGYDMGASHGARMLVTLQDRNRRGRDLWQIADDVYARAVHEIPGIRRLLLKEMGSDVMASSMTPVELVLRGPNLKRLAWLGQQSAALGRQVRGLHMVATSWSPARAPRVLYQPLAGPGKTVGTTRSGLPVVIEDGQPWPDEPAVITHDDLQRSLAVTGTIRREGIGSMQLAMQLQMLSQSQLPFPAGYQLRQRGDMTQMMDSFERLLQGLGLALVLVYGVLLVWFRDWRLPCILLAAIPLELSGVVAALLLAGQTFSSVSLLGVVVLHGMDVTAGILLLERVETLRRSGLSARQAVLRGAAQRLRPVLMTVFVTLAVMVPLAFFPRTGMDAYAPLATVILGGLSVSALLTLLVTPLLYVLVFRGEFAARDAKNAVVTDV